jgi:uncharacterized protein (UPF0128 family)
MVCSKRGKRRESGEKYRKSGKTMEIVNIE